MYTQFKLCMTSSYVMHVCIKNDILFTLFRAGLHVNHAVYEARTHVGNSFEVICV